MLLQLLGVNFFVIRSTIHIEGHKWIILTLKSELFDIKNGLTEVFYKPGSIFIGNLFHIHIICIRLHHLRKNYNLSKTYDKKVR